MQLNKLTKKQLLKLLGIVLLSDGYVRKYKGKPIGIRLYTVEYNQCQHTLFNYLCENALGKSIKTYNVPKYKMIRSELFGGTLLKKVYSLSPNFQTTPSVNQTKEEYLKTKQPTLGFIRNDSLKFKWLALMLYFDFDGSITPSVRLKHKKDIKNSRTYEYYQVQMEIEINIAETNPQLNKEIISLCSELGLNANRTNDKRNWSSIGGIRICDVSSVKKFIKHNTITNVKISSKSPRFKGLTKSLIIKSIGKILEEIPLSKSFKIKAKAVKYRNFLNNKLLNIIHSRIMTKDNMSLEV